MNIMANNKIETNSFWSLFKDTSIEVPKIQRDYAQGRLDSKIQSIRNTFLNELIELIVNDKSKELDFIYGSIQIRKNEKGKGENVFIPLDGQQRLTTLFLIYWYLSTDRTVFCNSKNESRFTYETRISSRLFCNELVNYTINYSVPNLTDCIKDTSWYSQSWNYDPTIKAMLVMIDAIHMRFKDYSEEERSIFWNRLTSENAPVTFQLLYLDNFALTDELYIKMNARGKALTEFENFKSFLDEEIDLQYGVNDKFSERWKDNIDGAWMDLFWKYRNKADDKLYEIDDQYIHFFKGILSIHLISNELIVDDNVKKDYVIADFLKNVDNLNIAFINILNDSTKEIPNYIYKKIGVFTKKVFETIESILGNFVYKENGQNIFLIDEYLNDLKELDFNIRSSVFKEKNDRERTLFDTFVNSNATYKERVLFYAFAQFIKKHGTNLKDNDIIRKEFFQWMRIIRNLSENRQFNDFNDFKHSIYSIDKLIKVDNILNYFSDPNNPIDGFNGQQIEEERIKASLLLRDNQELTKKIRESEEHKYFLGQIDFLLNFSGVDINNASNCDLELLIPIFDKYKNASETIFNGEGLNDSIPNFLFERTILSFDDYLFQRGRNWSFLVNNDRDISWKRMLNEQDKDRTVARRNVLKTLIDHHLFDLHHLNKSLGDVIKMNLTKLDNGDWRRIFIEDQRVLGYCGSNKLIRWENENEIYLLQKERMSGAHAEYRSYALFLKYKDMEEKFAPFQINYYSPSGTDDFPCLYLELEKKTNNNISINIHYLKLGDSDEYAYQLSIFQRSRNYQAYFEKLNLEDEGFFWMQEYWNRYIYIAKDLNDLNLKTKKLYQKVLDIEGLS